MDPKKKYSVLTKRQKAEQKFWDRYTKKPENERQKREYIVFLEGYFENFGKMFALNILYLLASFPSLFCGYFMNQLIYSEEKAADQGVILMIWLAAVLFGIILGPATSGMVYVMRCVVSRKPAHISDFFRQFGKNFVQSIPFGIVDSLLLTAGVALIPFLLNLMRHNVGTGTAVLLIFCSMLLFLVLSARPYIYLMTVTINLKVWQIFRNGIAFAFLGVKRNIASVFVSMGLIVLGVYGLTLSEWVLFYWGVCGMSLTAFIQVFRSYDLFYQQLVKPEEERMEAEENAAREAEEKEFVSEEEAEASEAGDKNKNSGGVDAI